MSPPGYVDVAGIDACLTYLCEHLPLALPGPYSKRVASAR